MALVTAKGQTLQELSTEFIEAMKQNKSGSDTMTVFAKYMESCEETDLYNMDKIRNAITNVRNMGFNAFELPIWKNTNILCTHPCLAYICIQSSAIPDYITATVALYAASFYREFPKGTKLSLGWIHKTVGYGKLIEAMEFFPWIAAARMPDGSNLYQHITDEDIFVN